jgi:UDP-glucose 4-epimerase
MAFVSDHRVIITGSTGFIGQAVVPLLLAQGIPLLALSTRANVVAGAWGVESIDIKGGVDGSALERAQAFRPSVFLHLAWSGLPDYSAAACLENVALSANLIRMALDSGVRRFVGAGSCWEYGDLRGRLNEDMTSNPGSMFGQAKSCVRQLMEGTASDTGTEARWGRIFYVYGPGQRESSLIPRSIKAWREGAAPQLRDTQSAIDLVHIEDVARGILALTLRDGPAGVFNLGSGNATRVADVVEVVRAQVESQPVARVLTANGAETASWADINRIYEAFGWQPTVELGDGIASSLAQAARS